MTDAVDRGIETFERRKHDKRRRFAASVQRSEQIDRPDIGYGHIAEHDVEAGMLGFIGGLASGFGRFDPVAFIFETLLERIANAAFAVYYLYVCHNFDILYEY